MSHRTIISIAAATIIVTASVSTDAMAFRGGSTVAVSAPAASTLAGSAQRVSAAALIVAAFTAAASIAGPTPVVAGVMAQELPRLVQPPSAQPLRAHTTTTLLADITRIRPAIEYPS